MPNTLLLLGLFAHPDLEKIKEYQLDENIKGGINFSSNPLTKFFIIILLILLMVVIFVMFNKIIGQKKLSTIKSKSDLIEVMDVINLGFNEKIYLVKVINRGLLIGVSDKNMSCLLKLDEDINLNEYQLKQEDHNVPRLENFKDIFNYMLKRNDTKPKKNPDIPIKKVLNRIKDLKDTRGNLEGENGENDNA